MKTKADLLARLKALGHVANPVRVVEDEIIKEINKPNTIVIDDAKFKKKLKKLEDEVLDTLNSPKTREEAEQTFNDWENDVVAPLFDKYGIEYDDDYIEDFFENVYVPMWEKLNK